MAEDVSISINGQSHLILCGTCQQPITFIGERDVNSGEAGCISCGNIAYVEDVAQMAIQYAKDELQLIVNRAARDSARKSKLMNFEGKTTHNKIHRFIVNLKP